MTTLKELQTQAKELKVKNWWKMKKVDLEKEIQSINDANLQPELETVVVKTKKKAKAKKETKTETPDENANLITVKEIAAEIGIRDTKARRILRKNVDIIERPFKRWEWDTEKHQEIINNVKLLLSTPQKGQSK